MPGRSSAIWDITIDIVPGVFDDAFLASRHCSALELSREPLCCAVPVTHPLAQKEHLSIHDLYGQRLMLIQRGWNREVDTLRDRLHREHGQIEIVNFDFSPPGSLKNAREAAA